MQNKYDRELVIKLHGNILSEDSYLTIHDPQTGEQVNDEEANALAHSFNNTPQNLSWLAERPDKTAIIGITYLNGYNNVTAR